MLVPVSARQSREREICFCFCQSRAQCRAREFCCKFFSLAFPFRRRRAAKGRAKEEREERAELAPFGEDYGSGGLNRAEIDLFDDDGP